MTGKQADQILVDIINDKGACNVSGTDGDTSTKGV